MSLLLLILSECNIEDNYNMIDPKWVTEINGVSFTTKILLERYLKKMENLENKKKHKKWLKK